MIHAKVLHKSCIFEYACMLGISQDPKYMSETIHSAVMCAGSTMRLISRSYLIDTPRTGSTMRLISRSYLIVLMDFSICIHIYIDEPL